MLKNNIFKMFAILTSSLVVSDAISMHKGQQPSITEIKDSGRALASALEGQQNSPYPEIRDIAGWFGLLADLITNRAVNECIAQNAAATLQ